MKLDGDLSINLRQAMVKSLGQIGDIRDLLLASPIDERLEEIIPDDPDLLRIINGDPYLLTISKQEIICRRVIEHFNRKDKIEDLISAYHKKCPDHQDFLKVYKFAKLETAKREEIHEPGQKIFNKMSESKDLDFAKYKIDELLKEKNRNSEMIKAISDTLKDISVNFKDHATRDDYEKILIEIKKTSGIFDPRTWKDIFIKLRKILDK